MKGMNQEAFMNWSGGKDSALALYKAQSKGLAVTALLTSVNATLNRVSMHGVRRELLVQQAASLGLPLHTIELPEMPDMQVYENAVRSAHRQLNQDGFTTGIFGDIFLEDLKRYRENLLAQEGLQCHFPIWKMDNREVVSQFLADGFRAIVVCINSGYLDKRFCGRMMDDDFFNDLPPGVDPCGENGEYHSFVFNAPNFSQPIAYQKGELVFKEYPSPKTADCFVTPQQTDGFYFCDLLPV